MRLLPQLVCFLVLILSSTFTQAEGRIEFNRDIRPILSENCFYCHGFDETHRQGDLRLDTLEGALEGGAIQPHAPGESELMRRITSQADDELMPPPESEKQLTLQQRELIRQWIEQGAEYQQHWAWQSLIRPPVPKQPLARPSSPLERPDHLVRGSSAPSVGTTAIDRFLHASWRSQGITPAAMATPRERLRRLSFDLRGLPPTMAEVAEFTASPDSATFQQLRERWMQELDYAEHQAIRWLDLVRWADTSGQVSDEPIASGAYRAWIIRAFQANMPFDEFSTAQLAGDLLPAPTDDQLIASGYNRIVNTNCEAGAIEEEQLYKLKGEHVRALGTVWLGLTTGCAECHDHKFDPILAKDYYSLAAFFDDLVEAGVYTPGDRREPLHYVYNASSKTQEDRRLKAEIEAIQHRLSLKPLDEFADWEAAILAKLKDNESRADFVWLPAELPAPRVLEGSFQAAQQDGQPVRQTRANKAEFHRVHAAEVVTGFFSPASVQTDPQQDAWYADVWIDETERPQMLGLQISHGDYGRLGWNTANFETYVWGADASGNLSQSHPWSDPERVKAMGELPAESGWVRLRIPLGEQIAAVPGQAFEATGMAWLQTGGHVRWGGSGIELRTDKATQLQLGEPAIRRWWEQPKNREVYQKRFGLVVSALKTPGAQRDSLQNELLADAFREQTQPALLHSLRELESKLFLMRSEAFPVLVSKQAEQHKTTRLLLRGDYQDTTGPIVSAAVPEFLGNPIESASPNRLDLARWLFDEQNPLTARVYVNRLWQQFFGQGLSVTLDDSGTQGAWPSHPELLDWLACEFRDSGWDRDHMVRLLTSTEAYQLSSQGTPDLLASDPDNRLYARQGRFRLPAESIRDSALQAAGLLESTTTIPLQSFFPYQPSPYWTNSDKIMYGSRHMRWETSPAGTQYRRSLYTFWKRQNIHPTLLAFDAPTRQECTAERNITNTPGQALALLNDPTFVEAARVLATRLCETHADLNADLPAASVDRARIDLAYERTLQRQPHPQEIQILLDLLASQRDYYQHHQPDAQQLLSVGQTPATEAEASAEIAAWTSVARAILNLHEFLNRT
ncbi:PSD1 and planctomycete cytochrome C domain-containing protein [Aureliella helgolandensis]|uniref:Planctomycete cytochrome C n=1 Tax=Aureliella helgolandensis TaxID=2527968 RepID=A0A518GAA1_9BACT|nr:PSD1 and planctomycete cytochrome C domain-containing protein [Aureliella helgolandensis]QDV25526.1 Planctomycete cytochrome C [Aureliella helgolandensis]